MGEPHPLNGDPGVVAGADQELAQTRVWLRALADLHLHAVEELGALEAMVGLAAHIRDSVKAVTADPSNAHGWGIAAIAVGLLAEHLHPPAELPPLVIRQDDPDFVPKVVQALLGVAPCCVDHADGCQAPAYPCCDGCPDQGD